MAYSQAIVQRAMQRLQSENEQNEQSSRARIAAIYEKQPRLGEIERELVPHYGADSPAVVAYRVGWPDQMLIRGTLSDIREKVRAEKITRTALILVGPAMGEVRDFTDSALYDATQPHVLRPRLRGAAS